MNTFDLILPFYEISGKYDAIPINSGMFQTCRDCLLLDLIKKDKLMVVYSWQLAKCPEIPIYWIDV